MARKSIESYAIKPGNWDRLHLAQVFPTDNEWGIPYLPGVGIEATPDWLAPYGEQIRTDQPLEGATHFFLDDFRFEGVWNQPVRTLSRIQRLPLALSPDFSLYRDYPRAAQVWNTYRNRWCGAYWYTAGVTVIPTISWSTPDSFEFCFVGVEVGSLVAIGTVGINFDDLVATEWFLLGYRELVRRLRPGRILCYGKAIRPMTDIAEVVTYPTRWTNIRAARKAGRGGGFDGR